MVSLKVLKDRDEWLANRMKGIGGSEISAVVGCNPYMTNIELWELKTGRRQPEDISGASYVQYGINAEPLLRDLFKLDFPHLEVRYLENNSVYNDRFPWARASLDGWTIDEAGRHGVLEIKTTNILQSMQREKWKDAIPQNYYCQCLFYMAVAEADYCDLTAQLKSEFKDEVYKQTKHYHIERYEVKSDIDFLMAKGKEFWEYVKKDERPPLVLPQI